jgi:hypothetical protein
MIPGLLAIIIAFSVMGSAIVEITLNNFTIVGNMVKSQQAFNIAEAGLNYYMWHLNHNSTDYKDGQSTPTTPDPTLGYGPYTHNYIDTNGVNEGTYTLWINPAGNGSTVVTVRSIGQAAGTSITRTVQAQIGTPSFASYAVTSDSALWFGNTESADGPVESNQGVRMDGPSDSTVSSANSTYTPAYANGGCASSNCSEPGVWCSSTVTSPVNCNTRSKSDWIYPVPQINFNQVSSSLCTMKKVAFANYSSTAGYNSQSNPCNVVPATNMRTNAYIPELSSSFSYSKGYLIKLNSNNTYDLLQVNSENDRPIPYSTYSNALSTTPIATQLSIPSSGVIFVEDNVWVLTPTNFNGRVTIASGRLATSNSTDIVIAGPLLYAAKNGSDAIGLVTEDSIFIAPYAPASASGYSSGVFNYEVDGALLAENGNVEYGENGDSTSYPAGYRTAQSTCARGWTSPNQTMTFYGSVATRQTWTWSWLVGNNPCGDAAYDNTNGNGYITGFENDTTSYDYNLEYAPPPSYPITSGYNILSWREVLTHP